MRPLIGITAGLEDLKPDHGELMWQTQDYFRSLQMAGGIPVLLPLVKTDDEAVEVLSRMDGLLLSGGVDLDPQVYGEQPHLNTGAITPERDETELAYARVALKRDMPVLGICRGHQILAVAAGGTLWQDIPSQMPGTLKHFQDAPRWFPTHRVKAQPGTRVATLMGAEFRVNSYHHQAVRDIPSGGWVASAAADDGVNEALEHPGYKFMLSVQWHPECFSSRENQFHSLFVAFVDACRPAGAR